MPCTKCKDGKYKWGERGECKYDTKEACEKANPKHYNKMKPTPIGKKTYEEYAKELKEYKADEIKLSKAQKINLGIIQDGEKASEKIKTLIKEGQDKISFLYNIQTDTDKLVKVIKGMRSEIVKKLNVYDSEVKYFQDAKKDLFMTGNNLQKAVEKLNNIAKELTVVEKDMGIKVPGLSEFKKLATQGKSFDARIEGAFNKASLPEKPSQSF
tara:strand:+ start:24678 stop:25313 length:636 start_codon:yes stop_codon:yes gene_type:complete